jgi:hypothetical protein
MLMAALPKVYKILPSLSDFIFITTHCTLRSAIYQSSDHHCAFIYSLSSLKSPFTLPLPSSLSFFPHILLPTLLLPSLSPSTRTRMEYTKQQGSANERVNGASRSGRHAGATCLNGVQGQSQAPTRVTLRSRQDTTRRPVSRRMVVRTTNIIKKHDTIMALVQQVRGLNDQLGHKPNTLLSFPPLHRISADKLKRVCKEYSERIGQAMALLKMSDPTSSSSSFPLPLPLRAATTRIKSPRPSKRDEAVQIINDLDKLSLTN